ncbi:hypothetical protein [Agrobacterium sp. RAC06]|uniref:hypothetical protein n=1 Tax=Agrobacterium sp. RAC06 TaxID=1842536 RepID=UPI00123710BF|nr:hypothetical protein [Agrobacterium sp. RAC06]
MTTNSAKYPSLQIYTVTKRRSGIAEVKAHIMRLSKLLISHSIIQSSIAVVSALLPLQFATSLQAQSFNEMASESSAQAFYADVQRRISAGIDDGPSYQLSRDYTLTPEQEAQLEQRRQDDETVERLRKDPVFMRYWQGYWDHYQARAEAQPGEFCAATYVNLHGSVTLTGADKSWDGGLLMFVGKDIPRPKAFREISASLTQDDGRPATVRIYNMPASSEMPGVGTLIFAVPSMPAALSGMRNEQRFVIAIDGKEVFRMSWKDGKKASNALRKCIRKR